MSAFLSVTKDNTIQERNTLAIWITLWILIISGVLLFFGGFIFKIFGITLDAFRIGTGALLFLTAVSLVRGDSIRVPSGDSVQSLAVVPMAIPITLGPASIGVLMVYGGEIKTGLGFFLAYLSIQFLVLKELTGCRSYTIVGDSNQRLIKAEEVPAMLKLKEIFGGFFSLFELKKSYRSTYQIMEYASKLLDENAVVPFVRKGEFDVLETIVPKDDKDDLIDVILNLLEDYQEEKYENIAIITKDKEELNLISPGLKKYTNILAFSGEDVVYKGGKVLIPSYYAKGLEFDAVIIVDFDENTDNLIKYIMCTRALHRLSVVKVR